MNFNYSIYNFCEDIQILYSNVNVFPFRKTTLPIQMKKYGDLLESFFKLKFIEYKEVIPEKLEYNKNVAVAFSGGKDSAALSIHLKQKENTVTLMHFTGMNKAYPDEAKVAEQFACKYGFNFKKLRSEVKVEKGTFIENIAKNQLLIAECLKAGYNFEIYNVGLGCASLNTELLINFGFSDSQQSLRTFADGIESLFGNKIYVSEIESEGQSYKILIDNNISFKDIVSCMIPLRYRGNLRKKNSEKGMYIRPDGCGQCYKCAGDYYYLGNYDKISDIHYLNVLKKHWEHFIRIKPKNVKELIYAMLNDKYVNVDSILNRYMSYNINIEEW